MASNTNDDALGQNVIGDNSGTTTSSTVTQQKFITRVLNENNGQVIGAEVVISDADSNVIDTIVITDQTTLQKYINNWDAISKYYVIRGDVTLTEDLQALVDAGQLTLQDILKNTDSSTEINATKLNGTYDYTSFAPSIHNHDDDYCVTKHDSSNKDYGVSTKDLYGHCKIADRLTDSTFVEATALSSHQGYVLNESISALNKKNAWSSVQTLGSHIKYRVNSDLRLVVCNYSYSDYTGLKNDTGKHELHPANYIKNYAPTARVITPMYRGDVTLYFNSDGSVAVYNLTKIKKMNLYAQVMWHY